MADTIVSLWCENCGKACKAKICGSEGFLGSDCCEGYLLRRITSSEEGDIVTELFADDFETASQKARRKWLDDA